MAGMRTLILVLGVMVSMLGGCGEGPDSKAVRAAFRNYDETTENRNGIAFCEVITKGSFERYDRLLKVALTAKRAEVKALRPSDKLDVLMMRYRATKSTLKSLEGKTFARWHVEQGWASNGFMLRVKLREIRVMDDKASGEVVVEGDRTHERFTFLREDGVWKLDEPSACDAWDRWLKDLAKEEHLDMDSLIMRLERESTDDDEIPDEVWDRVLK